MTPHDFSENDLRTLANLQISLLDKGGPTNDGELFEEVLFLQDDILKSFGLPIHPDYEKIIWFTKTPTPDDIEDRIKQLHSAATDYLTCHTKSETQTLKEAQDEQKDPRVVLPELKIPTHIYSFFVYDQILLKHKDSIENILTDLRFISKRRDILNDLGKIAFHLEPNENELKINLEKEGVRYLKEFCIANS